MEFITIIGAISIIVPIFFLISRRNLRKNGIHTTATVLQTVYRQGRGRNASSSYWTVFEFRTNGQTVEVEYNVGIQKRKFRNGSNVEIIYHPNNPERIIVENDRRPMVIINSVIFMVFGAVLLGIGLFSIFS